MPKKASRLDLVVLKLVAAEKLFRRLLCWFHDFREFIEAYLGQTEPREPYKPPGRALAPRGPLLHLPVPSPWFWNLRWRKKYFMDSSVGFMILENL